MKYRSPLAIAALAGIVATGSLAATLSVASPALAEGHHGNYAARDHRDDGRDRDRDRDRRDDRGYAPAYVYQQPAYRYAPAYAYPAYPAYPAYVQPSGGFVHVSTPGFSLGFGF
jgi:Ni/Co efflux regulator RcnB